MWQTAGAAPEGVAHTSDPEVVRTTSAQSPFLPPSASHRSYTAVGSAAVAACRREARTISVKLFSGTVIAAHTVAAATSDEMTYAARSLLQQVTL